MMSMQQHLVNSDGLWYLKYNMYIYITYAYAYAYDIYIYNVCIHIYTHCKDSQAPTTLAM